MKSNTLKVGHLDYTVSEGDPHVMDGLGVCIPDEQKIVVRSGLTRGRTTEVLLHEVLHAIADQAGLADDNTEEEWVIGISKGLLAVLRSNPWLDHELFLGLRADKKNYEK